MCAGMGAVTDLYRFAAAGVVVLVEADSMSFEGEADDDLSSAFWGDFFFFFRVTSTHSSTVLGVAWSCSFSVVVSLMVTVETVVAAASVAAAAAGACGGSFLGQTFDICPSCLQLQQRGRLPSTITIICLFLLTMVSGIAWKPSRVRHIRNTVIVGRPGC